MEVLSLSIFFLSIILAWVLLRSEKGWFWILRARLSLNDRVLREDALKYFTHCEIEKELVSIKGLSETLGVKDSQINRIMDQLSDLGMLVLHQGDFILSDEGRRYGLKIIRAHRLYETYMSEKTGFTGAEWHSKAEVAEHKLTDQAILELDKTLNYPIYDPHGDPIPSADGTFIAQAGRTVLANLEVGQKGLIVHLEDEPTQVYSHLRDKGLYPGLEVLMLENGPQRLKIWGDNEEHILTPLLAANVTIVPKDDNTQPLRVTSSPTGTTLATAPFGRLLKITTITPRISGSERRRLMDLGFLPGTTVEKEFSSASGDPIALRIRGSLMALRTSQASQIYVDYDQSEILGEKI